MLIKNRGQTPAWNDNKEPVMARNNKIRFRLAMLGALGLSLAGCGGDSSESPAPIAETSPEAPMKEQPGEVEQPRAIQQMMTLGTRQQEAGQVQVATSESRQWQPYERDRKSTRLNSSHVRISYAVFCLKKKKNDKYDERHQ